MEFIESEFKFRLIKWTNSQIQFSDFSDKLYSFDIIHNIPFSSERKSMGIIVRDAETKEVFYYIKGADVII